MRRQDLPRHLNEADLTQLLSCLDVAFPLGLRDRAMLLCLGRLELPASAIAALCLADVDWRNATIRVTARKTGRGAVLPHEVGTALADHLTRGRPPAETRRVFVQHRGQPGAPIVRAVGGDAVDRAVTRVGIQAPTGGANLLRHSLALVASPQSVGSTGRGARWWWRCATDPRISAPTPRGAGSPCPRHRGEARSTPPT